MKKFIIKIIYFLIKLIEKYEYRNINLDENDISKKILNTLSINGYKVKSDTGFEELSNLHITQPYTSYTLRTEQHNMECADNHIVFDEDMQEIFVSELNVGDKIWTENGLEYVTYLHKNKFKYSMFDTTVNSENHRLYTNGILSHNTISAAIFMVHTILFNNDKNVMIVANKGDTAVEIVDKIKSIYSLLPFFLKPGIKTWNQKSLTFENGCRIKTSARTKTPAIGFTIDVLYLDEFAHIPSTIIEPYYTAAFPTTAAVQNSKIIITSTPNGMNLFHKLLTNAERPVGDPQKNNYKPMRVYWYQVPGRFVTYVRLSEHMMYENNMDKNAIYEQIFNKWGDKTKIFMEYNMDLMKDVIHVNNNENVTDMDVKGFHILDGDGKEISILSLAEVTTWKDEAIKDIGGEDAFNQEYGLRFINASESLLTEALIDDLINNKKNYVYEEIDEFENRLRFSYKDLKWTTDENVFLPLMRKNYKYVISVDISEGLGQDYSVINIFRISEKSWNTIDKQKEKYTGITDFYKLEQVGIYRSNLISVKQLAELLYVLVFEYLEPDNCKVVVELNNYGNTLFAELPNVFDGNNNYGSYVFARYKHRIDSAEEKLGLKVGSNKNMMVKDYQELMQSRSISVTNEENIMEITTFIKQTTSSGNITYAADIGHDDCLLPDTMIKTIDGYKKIKDIKLDDEVLTHLGNYKKVTNICVKDFDGDMYKVKFKGQIELDITYNHPLYIASENYSRKNLKQGNYNKYEKRSWLLPNEIKKKHRCVMIEDKLINNDDNFVIKWSDLFTKDKNFAEKNIKVKEIEFNDNFSKFVGLFLADGNCYKPNDTTYRLSIAFNKNQIELINEVKSWLLSWNLKYHEKYDLGNSHVIIFNNKTFYELMIDCYDKETKEKIMPVWYKKLHLNYVLDYWLKGDGWSSIREGRSDKMIGCSTSLQLALSMRDISLSLGKHSSINRYKRKRYDVSTKDQYWVTIYDKRPKSSSLKKVSEFEYTSIIDYVEKYNYKGVTYNLEVEDDNSYIANGMVVHNCVMTIVNATTVFNRHDFREMVEDWSTHFSDKEFVTKAHEILKNVEYSEGVDYDQLLKVRRNYINRNSNYKGNMNNWFGK
jgi:intein/homing endonuclease